jgi:hypothetical protein
MANLNGYRANFAQRFLRLRGQLINMARQRLLSRDKLDVFRPLGDQQATLAAQALEFRFHSTFFDLDLAEPRSQFLNRAFRRGQGACCSALENVPDDDDP